jgi:2-polyprenyl-6-methoxyphenol hydroxylase-like FAD-dependent oxidoreductase
MPVTLPSETDVLIVGAGPAGLAAAVTLAGHGVPFVLIDRLEARQTTSRAAAVHARTLETLEKLGVVDSMVAAGRKIPVAVLRDRDKPLLRLDFSEIHSRYRFILTLPQSETEAILTARLEALGGRIERRHEAVAVTAEAAAVSVTVRDPAGVQTAVRARYVAGADGYHSLVRDSAGIEFAPGTYAQSFVLADVHMDWPLPPDEMQVFLAREGVALVAPFSPGRYRIVATADTAPESPGVADMQAILDSRGPLAAKARVHDVVWSSRFRIHHGVAARYRAGRVFLAGDAAHVHSPAGGQGMNIGIQDAVALGDRLAEVLAGRQPDTWLDGYETERRPVAEQVVSLTDRMTRVGTMTSPAGQVLRNLMLRAVGRLPAARARIAARMAELGPVAG